MNNAIRRLKLLIILAGVSFCAACGTGKPDDPATAVDSAVVVGSRVATGGASCNFGSGVPIVIEQPITVAYHRGDSAYGIPSRVDLTVTPRTATGVESYTQARETMDCGSGHFLLDYGVCSYAPMAFCNTANFEYCTIYRKDPGASTWHQSRVGWVDVQNARYLDNIGHYILNFYANWWWSNAEGVNGCGSTSPQTTYYEFY